MQRFLQTKDGKEMRVIGICLGLLARNSQIERLVDIYDELQKAGFYVLIFSTFGDLSKDVKYVKGEGSIFSLINYDILEALLVCTESIKNEDILQGMMDSCKERDIPFVSLDTCLDGCYNVVSDNKDALYQMVLHVIDKHNCKTINMISGTRGNAYSEERVEAYRQALADRGIPYEEERVGWGKFWEGPTREVMEEFLAEGKELPDAIVCANDAMAMAACECLAQKGYSIPDDVIVTGFDGSEIATYHVPTITTGSNDHQEIAKKIIDMLNEKRAGTEPERIITVPCRLDIKQSCGCGNMFDIEYKQITLELRDTMIYHSNYRKFANAFCEEITDTSSLNEAIELLKQFIFDHSFLVLDSTFTDSRYTEEKKAEEYSNLLRIPLAKEGESFFALEDISPDEILPDLAGYLEKRRGRMFLPLYFQNEVIGYFATVVFSKIREYENLSYFMDRLSQSLVLVRNAERMNYLFTRDHLTGIYNRRGFYQNLKKMLSEHEQSGKKLVMLSVDLDGLKQINDTYGHKEGDNAIWQAANALRIAGERYQAICSRFGGDEYVAAMVVSGDAEGAAEAYKERFNQLLRTYSLVSEKPYNVQGSVGSIVVSIEKGMKVDTIISSADQMMYQEKASHHMRDGARR